MHISESGRPRSSVFLASRYVGEASETLGLLRGSVGGRFSSLQLGSAATVEGLGLATRL